MPVLDDATQRYLLSPEFATRAKALREKAEAGEKISIAEMADFLGVDADLFGQIYAAELLTHDPEGAGVLLCREEPQT